MRVLKPLAFLFLAIVVLAAALLAAAPHVAGSARVRLLLAQELTAITGKPVSFAGPVDLRLFPRLEVSARDVRIANPPGYSQPHLALVGEISARIAARPLLRRQLVLRDVEIAGLQLALEEGPKGPNWTLPAGEGEAGGLPPLPGEIRLRDATISYRAGTAEPVEVKVDAARVDPGGGTGPLLATLAARFQGQRIALDTRLNPLADLVAGKPLALRGTLDLGPSSLRFEGGMAEPLRGRGLDMVLAFDGPGLAALSPLVGGALPPSEPVSFAAALRERPDGGFEMGGLRLGFGDSVIEGGVAFRFDGPRPRLDVTLRSAAFDLVDLLGRAPPAPDAPAPDAATLIALPDTLPDGPLPFALLRALDATLRLSADSFRAGGQTITALDLDAGLENGRLAVNRLAGTLGDGSIDGRAAIDATVSPPVIDGAAQLSGLDIGGLLGQADITTIGMARARVTFKTTGASPRALATALEAEGEATGIDLRLGPAALPLTLTRASLRFAGAGKPIEIAAAGSSRGEALQLTGRLDPLAAYGGGKPYAGTAQLRVGRSQASLALSQADAVDGLRLRFDANGPTLIDLTALAGLPLPLGPYRLAGTAQLTARRIALSDLAVDLPGTRLAASGGVEMTGARPVFTFELRGDTLDLDRLTAALGAPGTQARNRAPVALPGLDATPLDPDLLRGADLALDLDVKAMRLAGQAFGPTVAALRVADGTATLTRLTSDLAGAPLSATARLAGGAQGFDATLSFAGRDLGLAALLAGVDRVQAAPSARLVVEGDLSARGRSIRDLALGATGNAVVRGFAVTLGDPRDIISDVAIDLPRFTLTAQGRGQPLLIQGDGAIAGAPATLRGKILALDDAQAARSVPVELTLETQGSRVALRGATPDPAAPLDLTLALEAQGRLLRDLAALGGFDLTPSGPYTAAGTIHLTPDDISARDVSLQVGESRISGSAQVAFVGDRPRLTAALTAPRLRLEDFDHAAAQASKAVPGKTPVLPRARARLLPPDRFPLDLLKTFDGDITLRAASIEGYGVHTRDAAFAGKIANGLLTLSDMSGMMEGGRLALRGTIDGRGNTAVVDLAIDSRSVDLGALLGVLAQDEGIPAMLKLPLDSTIRLAGAGTNAQALAATLKGSVRVVANQGYVRQGGFTFIEGGLLRKLAPWENRDRTTINCFVGDFTLDRGVATTRSLLLDTEYMSVGGTGTIDLGREQANMVLTPRPKEIRLLDLAVPVSVTGPLGSPSVTPTPGGTARRLITTLGVFVNPLVLVVPVIEGVTANRNPCEAALEKPAATPGAAAPAQPGGILGGVGRGLNRVFGD